MSREIFRKFLEIKSILDLKEIENPSQNYSVELANPQDFQLNKFFYKNIGKKYRWLDRLEWNNKDWVNYVSNKKLSTFVLKDKDNMAGYFEIIFNKEKKEAEIAYFGILEEYFGKKLGGFLLSEAIKKSFVLGAKRVWLHTCSLDHENALKNYLARGMKIFRSESLTI